jgi:hypothetical protein
MDWSTIMNKKSIIRWRHHRPLPMYGFAPDMTQHNPVGDADLHIQGVSQPLYFKDMASVFPEKVIFDLTLSVAMVEHNATVSVISDQGNDQNIIEHVYHARPAVQSISWSKPFNVHCMHQGTMRPHDPSWTIAMPYDAYQFDTLEDGETSVQDNQYYAYGGLWDAVAPMDTIARAEARFSLDSEDVEIITQDTFGQAVRRGGVQINLLTTRTSILTFGAYKMYAQQPESNNGFNDAAEPYIQQYRSIHYDMMGQTTMRMHFVQNNTP